VESRHLERQRRDGLECPTSPTIASAVVAAPARRGEGGLGSAAAELADGLEALGRAVTYVGSQPRGALARMARSRPLRRALGMGPSRRMAVRAVRRAVPGNGWDLAYTTPGAAPIGGGTGVRVIYQATRHPAVEWAALRQGERETGGRGDMTRPELRRREYEIERADLIHVTSHAVCEEMLAAGVPEGRLVHSYHGVDLDLYRPATKRESMTIAFIGPLSLRKGVDVAAELAERLGSSATVESVGGATCPWSRRVAAGATFVPRPSARETLSTAHALVLPSRSDGFSFVVLEALASGAVPIVTPEVGASEIVRRLDERLVIERTEFVECTAELLPRLDFDDLSARARALAERFDRRETSRAAAAAILARAERLTAQNR
jgi:glycosyltransferase involved in cell wall biosynthesis